MSCYPTAICTLGCLLIARSALAEECSLSGRCVPKEDLDVFVGALREKKCLQEEKPKFQLDPIVIITDVEGRVYYSGSQPVPYSVTMKWCNYEVVGQGKLEVTVAKREPPVWGFRFRPKFAGSFLFVDAFKQSSAGEAVDVGILWDLAYYRSFNLNVATGFRSVGAGLGMDVTKNFGVYAGYAFSWWTLLHNPQAGLYFSFW